METCSLSSLQFFTGLQDTGMLEVSKIPKESVSDLDSQRFESIMSGESPYQLKSPEINLEHTSIIEENAIQNVWGKILGNVGDIKKDVDACKVKIDDKIKGILEKREDLHTVDFLEMQWATINYHIQVKMMTSYAGKTGEGFKTMIRQA